MVYDKLSTDQSKRNATRLSRRHIKIEYYAYDDPLATNDRVTVTISVPNKRKREKIWERYASASLWIPPTLTL
jgi:hypothetical protein